MYPYPRTLVAAALAASLLAGCGGGGGGSGSAGPGTGPGAGGDNGIVLRASCAAGSGFQCSGSHILRIDNGVALTAAGVQVYGLSTSDLQNPNPDINNAYGLTLPSCTAPEGCGIAEVRIARDVNGAVSRAILLLDRLGITWDRRTERPPIIDTFSPEMGRATIDRDGVVAFSRDLRPPHDLSFYDYALKGKDGTQANYANNVYFPREEPPVRCPGGGNACPQKESEGVSFQANTTDLSWRNGGREPDITNAGRLHGDGDLRAGDDTPDPVTGERRHLAESDGFGPSYPGFKGYRTYTGYSYGHATLATWLTQDTVEIVEWTGDNVSREHNKIRRGLLAFGDVTPPGAVPVQAQETADYDGIVYGYYVPDGSQDIVFFRGNATVSVNFFSRQASVTVDQTRVHDESHRPIPAALTATLTLDPAASGLTNYLSGTVTHPTMQGGLSARLFGPLVSSGTSGNGPAEIGGTFSMANGTTGETVIGGFIARKR